MHAIIEGPISLYGRQAGTSTTQAAAVAKFGKTFVERQVTAAATEATGTAKAAAAQKPAPAAADVGGTTPTTAGAAMKRPGRKITTRLNFGV